MNIIERIKIGKNPEIIDTIDNKKLSDEMVDYAIKKRICNKY